MTTTVGKQSMETVIATRELRAERKSIVVQICENQRGRFLRITETSAGIDNIVIVPSTGIATFAQAVQDVVEEAGA
jgi:hypothetical protein